MTDYWSFTDEELEQLAQKFNIPPYSRAGDKLEHIFVDRDRIIETLLKRDHALAGETTPSVTNVVHVEKMYGSSIQQNTRGSVVKINFRTQDPGVREIVDELKELAGKLHLPEQADQQLRSDVATLEAQLRAPHPKPNIITECLYSLRTIVEIAVADMLAVEAAPHLPALLEKISRLLS